MKVSKILTVALALSMMTGSTALVHAEGSKEAPAAQAAPATPPPPGVTYVETSPKAVEQRFERLGVVEPSRVADVRSRLDGYIAERLFEEGQEVKEGQLLYRIERDMYEATLMMREAEMQDAKARQLLAEQDFERIKSLRETKAVAQEQMDSAESEKNRSNAAVARAEAALREAKLDLKYTEVIAPVSGIVGKAIRDRGDYVNDGDQSLLTSITRISPVYVTYGLGEVDYLALRASAGLDLSKATGFQLVLANGEIYQEKGTLNYQSPDFEPSTGMLRVRIEFPNPKGILRPNQFVKLIEDHGPREGVLLVPKQSVIQTAAGAGVFVIDANNTLQFRPVKVGDWKDEYWEIASGLEPGERVMVDGLLKSKPGAPVTPSLYVPKTTD